MPFANVNGTRLYYRLEGQPGKPVIVLAHSIGTDHGMWTPQVADLLPHFQILRFDTRGHGASDAPEGEYSVDLLARDVLALADQLNIRTFAFCGLSMSHRSVDRRTRTRPPDKTCSGELLAAVFAT